MYHVYMIKNKNNNLYVGISQDVNKRLEMHNRKAGADFTKNKSEFTLVFSEKYNSLKEARHREIQIKKWRRDKKEFLIERYSRNIETRIINS